MEKEQLITKVSRVIMQLEIQKGPLKWSVSEVSRESQITRSLIYYHFGRKKNELLLISLENMMEVLFSYKNENLKEEERLKRALSHLRENPEPFILWYLYRLQENEFGNFIRSVEASLSKLILFNDYVLALTLNEH